MNLRRAGKNMLAHNMPMFASALAYSSFFAIPSVLLDGPFLIFGPQLEKLVGSAIGAPRLVGYLWWVLQWPILIAGLLAAFTTMLYLGPNLPPEQRRWRLITPGAAVAVVAWLAASG